MHATLIITNGESAVAAIQAAGVASTFLPWDDVLHEGPVPPGRALEDLSHVRARYLAETYGMDGAVVREKFEGRDAVFQQAGAFDEVVLWLEHDLYDQLQALQVLAEMGQEGLRRLRVIFQDTYIACATPDELRACWMARRPVSKAQVDVARRAWTAFRAPTPVAWAALLEEDLSALPSLHGAVERLLASYPAPRTGLSRTEAQILRAAAEGVQGVGGLFQASQAAEAAVFLGDLSFRRILEGLETGDKPLLQIKITPWGERVLRGEADRVALLGVDRWIGGVHLTPQACWRWDPLGRSLVPPST